MGYDRLVKFALEIQSDSFNRHHLVHEITRNGRFDKHGVFTFGLSRLRLMCPHLPRMAKALGISEECLFVALESIAKEERDE